MVTVWSCPRSAVRGLWPAHARPPPRRPRAMAASPADASRRRRENRRQLDARRSKCRIRLGGHMEQWCLLKERLGFSLHSQLAKFLLDRYTSGCVLCAGPKPLAPKGLQYLVLLSHAHSRECSLVPGLRGPGDRDGGLVWECSAGHTFSWGPSSGPTPPEEAKAAPIPSTAGTNWCLQARGRQEPAESSQNSDLSLHLSSFLQPRVSAPLTPPVPTGLESEHEEKTQETGLPRKLGRPPEPFLPPEEKVEEEDEGEEEMLSDASPWTYSSSPDDSEPDAPRPLTSPVTHALKEGETPPAPAAAPSPAGPPPPASSLCSGAPPPVGGGAQPALSGTPQAAQQTEALARKAARRELLPCDFPGCGRIFSNRQYLNHHKKYQHIHQKSFSCPEPACGKSFNFKKHLKEHVKLHSGQWGKCLLTSPVGSVTSSYRAHHLPCGPHHHFCAGPLTPSVGDSHAHTPPVFPVLSTETVVGSGSSQGTSRQPSPREMCPLEIRTARDMKAGLLRRVGEKLLCGREGALNKGLREGVRETCLPVWAQHGKEERADRYCGPRLP
uniref:Zinc finger protein 692 n=1 Tax=Rhinolophus ferrumequinum TaxID=59479 RepID=A0A671EZU4_RHIFE